MADYSMAIRLEPESARGYLLRGSAWLGQVVVAEGIDRGVMDEAMADFGAAIRLDPGSAAAFDARGTCWKVLGEEAKAKADFDEAARLAPDREKP